MRVTCNTNIFTDRKTPTGRIYTEKAINDLTHLFKEGTVLVLLEKPPMGVVMIDRSFGIAKGCRYSGNRLVVEVEVVDRPICHDIIKCSKTIQKNILVELDMVVSVCDDPEKCNTENQWTPGMVYGVSGVRYLNVADIKEWD